MNEQASTSAAGAKEGRLKQVVYLAILVPVLGLFVLALFPNAAPTQEVYGMVLRLDSTGKGDDEQLHLVVRLDSGEEVVSRIPTASLFRKAARVKLHRELPRLSDGPVFRFRGYVKGGA